MYPEMKNEIDYRVVIKIDLGPGRLNASMVHKWSKLGLNMKFGLPSGTSVNQEQDQMFVFVFCILIYILHIPLAVIANVCLEALQGRHEHCQRRDSRRTEGTESARNDLQWQDLRTSTRKQH